MTGLPHDERDRKGEGELQAVVSQVMSELSDRLAAPLSEADQLAIATAIDKALVEGYNRGVEKVAFEIADLGVPLELATDPISVADRWADYQDGRQ